MTALPALFTDSEACVREWTNQVVGLTGIGNPLTNGAHIGQASSPGSATWAEITRVGGTQESSGAFDQPRMSASVYGPNRGAAFLAARALANALRSIEAAPVTTASGRIAVAFNITVQWRPDGAHARWLVDFEAWISA